MLIKFLKSYDIWEDDCKGWFDLYSVDDTQVYPKSDYDYTPIPEWVFNKFEETLNGSKIDYNDVVLSLYYDLIARFEDDYSFDEFLQNNIYTISFLEKRMIEKLGVTIEIV